jgi:hypothetical protein
VFCLRPHKTESSNENEKEIYYEYLNYAKSQDDWLASLEIIEAKYGKEYSDDLYWKYTLVVNQLKLAQCQDCTRLSDIDYIIASGRMEV